MTERFLDPDCLARGNDRQRAAHRALTDLRIFETLAPFHPMLSGTIPVYHLALIGTHFMASNRPFGQARCAARCSASGKQRNAPDGRFHATEGRVLLSECGVALCLKCWALRRKARLAFGQNNPGEMGPYQCKVVLAIDVTGSDLDVLCEVHDFDGFAKILRTAYGHEPDFKMSDFKRGRDGPYRTASFSHGGFTVEVFGQALPVMQQGAYRHMVIQARLLALGGDGLRKQVVALRQGGLKTEPAFARRLGVAGDPYVALLALDSMDDEALRRLLDDTADPHGG